MNFKLIPLIIYFTSSIVFYSCTFNIDKENRVIALGKILGYPVAGKNGSKQIVYIYSGKKYFDVARFDSRYFTYGDKFLLYVNKKNPYEIEIPIPGIKFSGLNNLYPVDSLKLYLKKEDIDLLDSIPVWK